jgi:O-antigen ligase
MILFYVLLMIMPLSEHPIWSSLPGGGGLTVFKYLGLVCLVVAIGRIIITQRVPPLLKTASVWWFGLYFLIATVSYFAHGGELTLAPTPLASIISSIVLCFITVTLIDTGLRLHRVFLVGISSMGLASLYVIREWQKYHGVYSEFRGWGGMSGDPNYFTMGAIMWLPIAVLISRSGKNAMERMYCRAATLVILVAIMLSASRGGFIGLVCSLLFLLLQSKKRVRNAIAIAVIAVPLLTLLPASPLRRLMKPTSGDSEAANIRLALWGAGIQMVEENPLSGIGIGQFKAAVRAYLPDPMFDFIAHNTYLEAAAELGLFGLFAFVGMIVSSLFALRNVARSDTSVDGYFRNSAIALQAGLLAYSVQAFFISTWTERMFWFVYCMSVAVPWIYRRTNQTTTPEKMPADTVIEPQLVT